MAVRGNSLIVLKWLIPVRWGRFFERGTGAVLDLLRRAGYRAIEMILYLSALHSQLRAAAQTKFVRRFCRLAAAAASVGVPSPNDYSFLSLLYATPPTSLAVPMGFYAVLAAPSVAVMPA